MAISYVGKAFVMNTVSGVNTQVPMPSTIESGDRLSVLVGSIGNTSGSLTAPSGWTKVAEETAGTALRAALFFRTAGASEPTTYTWTFPNSGRNFGYAVAHRGVDADASHLAQATASTDDGAGPWATPSLALTAGDWLLTAAVARQNPGTSGTHEWSNATGTDVERFDLFTDVGTNIIISAGLWDSGGPVTTGSHSRSISSNVTYTQQVMIAARIPAAAGGDPGGGGNPWSHLGMPLG